MPSLEMRLSLPETVGLSLSLISPTVTAAFNITLVVQACGPAAPLTFALGAVAMSLVALSFMSFSHRVAHAGSAYGYVTHTFGKRVGFVTGCTLLLTYLVFTTGFAALVGSFSRAALQIFAIDIGSGWMLIGIGAMLVAWYLAYRDMRIAGRLMLIFEGASICGILALCLSILRHVHPSAEQALASFRPSAHFGGWTGLGVGMAFSILSYAGFEGAATLAEETIAPRRNIPIALFSSVLGSAIFFVFVAYCEITGFGPEGIQNLANSQAPLHDLALRFASAPAAVALDLAAAISCFAGVLGGLAASGRVLFALSRAGHFQRLAAVHDKYGTPAAAVSVTAIAILLSFVVWAPWVGAGNYYSYTATIGTLSLILIYIAVGSAEAVEASREQRMLWSAVCSLGPILLLWVLYRNIYPIPSYPNSLWPYVSLLWVVASWALLQFHPRFQIASVRDGR